MLQPKYIGHFDQLVDIIDPQPSVVAGEVSRNRTVIESNVNVMEINSNGSESSENSQPIYIERRSWVYRKFSRTFDTTMIARQNSKDYYITSIVPYRNSRNLMVMVCEYRDAQ